MKTEIVLVLAVTVCLGCRTAGDRQAAAPPAPSPTAAAAAPAENAPGLLASFGLDRALQAVGLQRAPEAQATMIPREVVQLVEVVETVVARSAALNINDPPEVTRQKALGILDALRSWDALLAAGQSLGVINSGTAEALNGFVMRLQGEAQKLVQYAPTQETIYAVQQLAGSLSGVAAGIRSLVDSEAVAAQALQAFQQR